MRRAFALFLIIGLVLEVTPALAQVSFGIGGGRRHDGRPPQWYLEQTPSKSGAERECEKAVGQSAVDICWSAVQKNSSNANLHRLLGDALLSTGRPAEALRSYETALQLKPGMPEAMRGRDSAQRYMTQAQPQQPPAYQPPPAYAAPTPGPYASAPAQAPAPAAKPAAAGPMDGEWSGRMTRQCTGTSDEGPASVMVSGSSFSGVFFSGGGGRDLNGRIGPDGSVEAAGKDIAGNQLNAKGRLLSPQTLFAEGFASNCKMTLTLGKGGAQVTLPSVVQVAAAQPGGTPFDGEWAGTITPRGGHYSVAAKVVDGKLIIDQDKAGARVKVEGVIDEAGQVQIRGNAGDANFRGNETVEIRGAFVGSVFQGQGRVGDRAASMELRRTSLPPTQTAAAPSAPKAATQTAAAPAPKPAPKPADTKQQATTVAPTPAPLVVDKQAPVITAPAKLEAKDAVVELAGKVADKSAIVEFTVNGQPVPIGADGKFTVRRGVPVGASELKLAAVDEWGNLSQKTVAVNRAAPAPSTQTAAAPAGTPAAQTEKTASIAERLRGVEFGRYHAVVIGNNKYRNVRPLDTASNDAKVVADILKTSYGFEVDLLIDATRPQILGALYKKRAQLTEKDSLLVYYAGHGVLDKESGRGYWLPIEAESDLPTNWVPTTDLTDAIRAMQARHIMVVADSCYSGTLVRSAAAGIATAKAADLKAWVQRVMSKRSRTVLSSGGLEPVMDGGGEGHSVFAKAFINALRDNPDVLDGQGLFAAIKRPIVLNSDQTPEYSDMRQAGHDGGDFLFVRR